jgi:chromosome partitioning protein
MYDERTNLAQQVTGELRKFFGEKLFATAIPRNVRLAEAPSHGKPALLYDVRSKGAESYIRLAKEVMDRATHRAERTPEPVPQPEAQPIPDPRESQFARVTTVELQVEPAEPAGVAAKHED